MTESTRNYLGETNTPQQAFVILLASEANSGDVELHPSFIIPLIPSGIRWKLHGNFNPTAQSSKTDESCHLLKSRGESTDLKTRAELLKK